METSACSIIFSSSGTLWPDIGAVTMPNGQVVNVQVPPGCAPGSQFTISVTQ